MGAEFASWIRRALQAQCAFLTFRGPAVFYISMASPLEREFEFYLEHQNRFLPEHEGKYLLIRDRQLVGAFETEIDALRKGVERFSLGTFLVQKCEAGEESYTETFHSRVVFEL